MVIKNKVFVLFMGASVICFVNGQQLSGVISPNMNGGLDTSIRATEGIGNPNHNLMGGVFASSNNLPKSPVTTGAFVNYNNNGHGLGLSHTNTPGVGTSFSQNAHVNLLQTDKHKLDANAFHSATNLDNGFKFNKYGGGLDYNHASGLGASSSLSRIPQIGGNTLDLTGKANLWKSNNGMSTFDATATHSKHFGGPFNGQSNTGFGLGLTHRF